MISMNPKTVLIETNTPMNDPKAPAITNLQNLITYSSGLLFNRLKKENDYYPGAVE